MAGSLNKVMLIGRLGKDPEIRYSASGNPVTNFTMATDDSYTDQQGNRVDKAEWHRVVVFGRQAETCANYLAKGRLVYVEGKLQTRQWEDQQGQKRYTTEVVGQRVQFLESRGGAQPSGDYDQGDAGYGPSEKGQGGQQPRGGQGGDQGGGQGRGQGGQQRRQQPSEDMGPAFPSEASGMDDVPF